LIADLLADPGRYEFFQAVRLLLRWLAEQGVAPRAAWETHLRFPNSMALRFPAGQIESLHQHPLPGAGAPQFRLTPTFFGLLGAHGALPLHDTERIAAYEAATGDGAARAFLDMFSTRLTGLFYEAWTKYRIEHAVMGVPDALLPLLLALAGIAPGVAHDGVPEGELARHAALLRARPLSAAMLARVLAGQLGVPVAIEEACGHWDRLASGERVALGVANAGLGRVAPLGERCWRPDLRVRVRLGPLDRPQFERFLPGTPGARTLRTLLGLFANPVLDYDIVLALRRADVAPVRLAGGGRLGLDSFMLSAPSAGDRTDLRYLLRPLGPLPPAAPPRQSDVASA
jgi:type VI secretion system protein ImpH